MRTFAFLMLVAALAFPACATARVKPWLGTDGSWATYSMTDVNRLIRDFNKVVADVGLLTTMDQIKYGLGFGAALGIDLPGGVALGLGYERLTASSGLSPLGSNEYPADALRAFAEYKLPVRGLTGLHLGAAGGTVSEAGRMEFTMPWITENVRLSGKGPLVEVYVGSAVWATPQFGLSGSLGYRYAKVGKVKGKLGHETATLYNDNGSKFTIDYSGMFMRLGLKAAAAEAPVSTDMKGRFSLGLMGGLGLPTGKLGEEITASSLSASDEGLPAGQKTTGHYGIYADYFVSRSLAVGADFGYLSTKGKDIENTGESFFTTKTTQFGVHGKYFIPTGGQVLPYLSLGFGLYNRKLDFTDFGKLAFQEAVDELFGSGLTLTTSYSDTKPGMNGGVGVEFKVNDALGIGASGTYHLAFGELQGPPVVGFPEETILKGWQYMAFNVVLTYAPPRR
jgi:opacity protein-like surface antigen